jgi:3,4-dihydroxy 2-butanone 4-phosphate synthase/GTP cyclohydrolase II
VLVYLRDGAAGVPTNRTMSDDSEAKRSKVWREVGLGAQILKDLGVVSIRNLSSTNRAFVGLSGFGIEITGTESL